MQALEEFIKILLPSALVLYAMYLTVRSFINKEREEKILAIKTKNVDTVLPIRLQAYERIALFLERITPNNLIRRLDDSTTSKGEFQQVLINEVRNEYNHNLSQQVYMSDEAWNLTKNAMEEVVVLINNAAAELDEKAKGRDLSKKIFNILVENNVDPTSYPLKFLKDEIRMMF